MKINESYDAPGLLAAASRSRDSPHSESERNSIARSVCAALDRAAEDFDAFFFLLFAPLIENIESIFILCIGRCRSFST